VARFLSPEWLAGMAAAAGESEALREAASGLELSVRQVVKGGPDGDVAYTVRLAGGTMTVVPGDGPGDVEVVSDYGTAASISQGRLSPAVAFASGRLKLGGRVGSLAGHSAVLSGLGDVFASLRATTEY
jgi:putative sterol carrier protein